MGCQIEGCGKPLHTKKLCRTHRDAAADLAHGRQCRFEDCVLPVRHVARGLCVGHNTQHKKGKALTPLRPRRRPVGYQWEDKQGYLMVRVPGHANANVNGYLPEHRYVMSQHLGRPLEPDENVHHLNGKRNDNRLENLELWIKSQPSGQRVVDQVAWAKKILARYGEDFL